MPSRLPQHVLNKYCTLHYTGEKLSFLYDATLFSHYKAKGLWVPAQAPRKTHLNKTGKQYSNVGNIYMSQIHYFILNPSLVLCLFTTQTHLPSIKPINNRYITQHRYKVFPPAPPTQNTIIFNWMIIMTMTKLQCELKIQIWYRKSLLFISPHAKATIVYIKNT